MIAGRQTHRHIHGQTDTQYAALVPEGGGRNKKFISFRSRDKPYASSIARFNVRNKRDRRTGEHNIDDLDLRFQLGHVIFSAYCIAVRDALPTYLK